MSEEIKVNKSQYFKSLTFCHLSVEEDKTGKKYIKCEDVDYYVDGEQIGCGVCGTGKFVYLAPAVSMVCKICFRCETTQMLGKAFGVSRKVYTMSPDEAIRILQNRGASRHFIGQFKKIELKRPFKVPRKRPKIRK